MIFNFSIINVPRNETIHFDRDKEKYLIDDNGLSWGEVLSNISYITNLTGVGSKVSKATTTNPRTITIKGWVTKGDTPEESIEQKKEEIARVINPRDLLRVSIGDYSIEGYTSKAVVFSEKWLENHTEFCGFSFSIECYNPYFYKEKFLYFGYGTESPFESGDTATISLPNEGDVDVGGHFVFDFYGPINNLYLRTSTGALDNYCKLTNLFGGSVYPIDSQLVLDTTEDYREVSTNNGKNFKIWDLDNDWISIFRASLQNDSKLTLTTDEGDISNIKLFIRYRELYTNMEDI